MFSSLISSARTTTVRASFVNIRNIHSTPVAAKTVTEKVSEVADTVNKKVGKGLASAIETGEKATQATKETIGATADEASSTTGQKVKEGKQKAEDMSNVVGQKANQAASGARQAKEDFEKEVRK